MTRIPLEGVGGLQEQARWLNGVLRAAGHQVEEISQPLAPWQRSPLLWAMGGDLLQTRKIQRAFGPRRGEFDLVLNHAPALQRPERAITIYHNSIHEYSRRAYAPIHPNRWKLRWVNERAERLAAGAANVAVSRIQAEGLRRLGVPNLRVLYNPIDAALFAPAPDRAAARRALGWPEDALIALAVARPERGKGWERARELAKTFPAARFYFVGPDALAMGAAPANCAALGLLPRERLPAIYQAADLFIFLPQAEGFGLALGEAMASGLAFLATPTGLGGDAVEAGGLLARGIADWDPRGDEAKFRELAESPALRAELGEAGRKFIAERAAPDRIAQEYLALVDEALASAKP